MIPFRLLMGVRMGVEDLLEKYHSICTRASDGVQVSVTERPSMTDTDGLTGVRVGTVSVYEVGRSKEKKAFKSFITNTSLTLYININTVSGRHFSYKKIKELILYIFALSN